MLDLFIMDCIRTNAWGKIKIKEFF